MGMDTNQQVGDVLVARLQERRVCLGPSRCWHQQARLSRTAPPCSLLCLLQFRSLDYVAVLKPAAIKTALQQQ
jgi:hypothetical protein